MSVSDSETEFYRTSLNVLNQLLEIGQINEIHYWNAVRTLPFIKNDRSGLSTESELISLFTFGSIKNIHEMTSVDKVLDMFGVKDASIYLIVNRAMNIVPDPDFDPSNLLIRFVSMDPRFVKLYPRDNYQSN